ncbi:hypothetical protein BHYA_0374g00070 [Botrytis hyacinthi]|uniref:Uncharacterized protein n=1 Tax=Botrytis hyacinthi TaxID=278943 RepID=A0A4Z1G977_9HELO|nr:hypothetical protein BHYA_0374g00070 [Botrytis hyacinthi]
MCITANTIKFLCDFECFLVPEKTHVYAKKHQLIQKWKGCDHNPDRTLRGKRFFESATQKPCHNRETARNFKICPECSAKYKALTERINSHVRMIIHLLEKAGGNIDTTGPVQKRASVCSDVIKWHIYLDDVARPHTYDQKHPSHPPNPEKNQASEEEYFFELQTLCGNITDDMESERSKPDGGDRRIIRELFCQQIRAEIEQHRIWVLMSEKYP